VFPPFLYSIFPAIILGQVEIKYNMSVCAGCHRELKKDVIYESGKAWCKECYKTEVLKI
jgi:hypothetical protein